MAVVCERFDDLGEDGAPARLGIMGGTFDPIHIGHLATAEQAREAFGLDAVVFVPAGNPVFKKDRAVTPAADRLAMCRLAVASNPAFCVSAMEIERGGDTYTVDTLRELVSAGRSIRYLVMQRVLDYIAAHGLYAPEAEEGVCR